MIKRVFKALTNLYQKFKQKPRYLIIHHSASSKETTVDEIRTWHIRDRKWIDLGYHKLINYKGEVFQGRPDAVVGAQAFGANAFSLGICCIGNYQKHLPSVAMEKALVQTLAVLCQRHNIPASNIISHRDVKTVFNISDPQAATSCPGDAFYTLLPSIRTKVAKYL